MSNFFSNKVITVDDRETIRTITIIIKVKQKKDAYKKGMLKIPMISFEFS